MMRLSILVLFLVACSKHDDASKPNAVQIDPPAPKPAGLSTLEVTADGKRVEMTSATLVHRSDGSLSIEVANNDLPCESARRSERFGVPKDDISFHAILRQHLAGDGSMKYVVERFGIADPKAVELDVSGPKIAIKATLDASGTGVEHWKHLVIAGSVTPTDCGNAEIEKDHPAIAKTPHPSTATLTIAGQRLAIHSAVRRDGKVVLSTEPMTCAPYLIAPRVMLTIGKDQWQLEGSWPDGFIASTGTFKTAAGKTGTSADGPTVELTLSGSAATDIYKLELAGTIEALDCKP